MSTKTHAITTMWSDESGVGTDQNSQAGIWQSGAGLVSTGPDRIVLTTGQRGLAPAGPIGQAPGHAVRVGHRLGVKSEGKARSRPILRPEQRRHLDANDADLGAGRSHRLPTGLLRYHVHRHLLVQQGKDGRVFLINGDHMGGFQQGPGGTDDVLQTLGTLRRA